MPRSTGEAQSRKAVTTPESRRRLGDRLQALCLLLGIVASVGPLLGVVAAIGLMLRTYFRVVGLTGWNPEIFRLLRLPMWPIYLGFQVFPLGLLLVSLSVVAVSRRLRNERSVT